jgi:hypothetical protein
MPPSTVRRPALLASLLGALAAAGCDGWFPSRYGTVAGRVVDATNGEAIEGILVCADFPGNNAPCLRTPADGHFRFESLLDVRERTLFVNDSIHSPLSTHYPAYQGYREDIFRFEDPKRILVELPRTAP